VTRKANRSLHGKERALPVRLLQVREAVMTLMRPILRRHGFTEQQWRVLRKLHARVPIDKTSLAREATLLPPSLTRILKDLEALSLVRTLPAENNPRLVRIVLTAKGTTAVRRTTADILAMTKRVRERTGDEAFENLLDALDRFEERLGRPE